MASSTFLLLCLQAFLIQTAFSQVFGSRRGLDVEVDALSYGSAGLSGYGLNGGLGLSAGTAGLGNLGANRLGIGNAGVTGLGLSNAGFSTGSGSAYSFGVPDVTAVASLPVAGPYGGTGYGELSVGGDIGAAGNTIVTGQVPVLGAVSFGGSIPAGGVVSLAGNCGCGSLQF